MRKIILLMWVSLFTTSSLYASPLPDFPFVAVEGTATKQIEPDQATITFSVTSYATESRQAYEALSNASLAVVNLCQALSIPDTDITAFQIDKRVKRKRDKDYNALDITGYEFSRRFKITLYSLDKYAELTSQLMDTQAVNATQVVFDSSKREAVQSSLIHEATEKAKRKANQMAMGLGVKLGNVFAFNDSGSFENAFATFAIATPMAGRLLTKQRLYADMAMSETLFRPQYIEISKTINVIYEIHP